MLSKNLSNSPAARIALLRLERNHHASASCHPMKKGFRTFKEHRKTSTSSAKFRLAVSNPKKNCWGKGTKTKTKIWHTVTYYHTDNVSTLITVLNTDPRSELAQGTSPKDSPKCWCAALGEVLLLRTCSSRERIWTPSAAARKLPQTKTLLTRTFCFNTFRWFSKFVWIDRRLRRPLTRKHSQATART